MYALYSITSIYHLLLLLKTCIVYLHVGLSSANSQSEYVHQYSIHTIHTLLLLCFIYIKAYSVNGDAGWDVPELGSPTRGTIQIYVIKYLRIYIIDDGYLYELKLKKIMHSLYYIKKYFKLLKKHKLSYGKKKKV